MNTQEFEKMLNDTREGRHTVARTGGAGVIQTVALMAAAEDVCCTLFDLVLELRELNERARVG